MILFEQKNQRPKNVIHFHYSKINTMEIVQHKSISLKQIFQENWHQCSH